MNELELPSVTTRTAAIGRLLVLRDGTPVHSGSAFVVAERLILTALHVIADRTARNAPLRGDLQLRLHGETFTATLVQRDLDHDWALLELDRPTAAAPMPLSDLRHDASTFSTWGFPTDFAEHGATFYGRIVNRAHRLSDDVVAYELKADTANNVAIQGLSGGPCVVNGTAVGVMRSAYLTGKQAGSTVVGGALFATPMATILAACGDRIPPVPEFPDLPPLPEAPSLPDQPFLYLNAYDAAHAELYFGRTAKIHELYRAVTTSEAGPLVLLVGATGVGKSSLLQAGLAPRLRSTCDVHLLRPTANTTLANTIAAALAISPPPKPGASTSLPELNRETPSTDGSEAVPVPTSLSTAWAARCAERATLVVLDQLEERYASIGTDAADAEVAAILAAQPAGGKLVLGFREELHLTITRLLERLGVPPTRVDIERLEKADIVDAITGIERTPRLAAKYHLTIDPDLPGQIADDLLEDPQAPVAPSLQVLLTKLYRAATVLDRKSPRFSAALYGNQRRASYLDELLSDRLAAAEKKFPVETRAGLVHDILAYHVERPGLALVRTFDERRTAYGDRRKLVEPIVRWLCSDEGRLLIARGGTPDAPTTRLVHDTLVPLVRDAALSSPRAAQVARRLLEYRVPERSTEPIPSNAEDWPALKAGTPWTRVAAPRETDYVARCRARARRKLAIEVGAGIIVLTGLFVLGLVADARTRGEQSQGRRAQLERLQRAEALFISSHRAYERDDLDEAARAAGDAIRLAEGDRRQRVYLQWLRALAAHIPERSLRLGADRAAVTDGGFVLASSQRSLTQVWDLESGIIIHEGAGIEDGLHGHRTGARTFYGAQRRGGDGGPLQIVVAEADAPRSRVIEVDTNDPGDDDVSVTNTWLGGSADGRWILVEQTVGIGEDAWTRHWWAHDLKRGTTTRVTHAQVTAIAPDAPTPVVITAKGAALCRTTVAANPESRCDTLPVTSISQLHARRDGSVVGIVAELPALAPSTLTRTAVGLWRADGTTTWHEIPNGRAEILDVSPAEDGTVLYALADFGPHTIHVWHHDRDFLLTSMRMPVGRIAASHAAVVDMSPGEFGIGTWSLADGRPLLRSMGMPRRVWLAPDGTRAHSTVDDTAVQYLLEPRAPAASRPAVPADGNIVAAVFRDDCRQMLRLKNLGGGGALAIAITDMATGTTRERLAPDGLLPFEVVGLALSPDGGTVAILGESSVAVGPVASDTQLDLIAMDDSFTWETGAFEVDGQHLVRVGRPRGGDGTWAVARIDSTAEAKRCPLGEGERFIGFDRLGSRFAIEVLEAGGAYRRELRSPQDCQVKHKAVASGPMTPYMAAELRQLEQPVDLKASSSRLGPPLVALTDPVGDVLSTDGTMYVTGDQIRHQATGELLAWNLTPGVTPAATCIAADGTTTLVTPAGDVHVWKPVTPMSYWRELVAAIAGADREGHAERYEQLTQQQWTAARQRLRATLEREAPVDETARDLLDGWGRITPTPHHQ